jgi:opacity protein-like surface antigen
MAAFLSAQNTGVAGARASGTAGFSFGDGGVTPSFGAALGSYWPARHVGVEFELAYSRHLEFTIDLCPPPLVCVLGGQFPVKGRTLSLIPHLVVEAGPWERVRPYVVGGIGMAHLRQRYTVGSRDARQMETLVMPVEFTRSKRALALSAGAGVDVSVSRRLALGVDVRSRHLFDEDPRLERFIVPSGTLSTIRVGLHTSWMF